MCTIRSDVDNWTEKVRVTGAEPTRTKIATQADSEDAFMKDVRIVGVCEPER